MLGPLRDNMDSPNDPNAPAAANPAEPRLLNDRVPTLRPDLNVVLKANSSGLYDVGRRGTDKVFTLYDFEVSIARMLNGRRTVAELIDAAGRIGIPVTLDSFQKFVRQLRAYDFLAEEAAEAVADEAGGTWTPREQWEPAVRELFQTALREFRKERYAEARSQLEALLQIQPATPEAVELLARTEERLASGATRSRTPNPDAPREAIPDAGRYRAGQEAIAAGGLVLDVPPPEADPLPAGAEAAVDVAGARSEAGTGPAALAAGDAAPGTHTLEAMRAVRRSRLPVAIAAGVAVIAMAGVLAIPVPCTVSAAAELSPTSEPVEVKSTRAGKVAKLLAQPGEWVEAGAPLVELDDAAVREEEISIQRELQTLARQLEREERRERSAAARRARAALTRKESEVAKLTALRDRFAAKEPLTSRLKRSIAATEKKLKKKQAELEKAKLAVARTSAADEVAALKAEQQAMRAKLEGLSTARTALVILAPAAGLFSAERRVGDPVEAEGVVGRVQDVRTLRARVALAAQDAKRVSSGDPVALTVGERPEQVRSAVSKISQGTRLWTVEAPVENAARTLPASATGAAEIQCGSRAFVSRLLP